MTSVDSCHADLGLAAVPCPDEVLTQLQKVSVATLFWAAGVGVWGADHRH